MRLSGPEAGKGAAGKWTDAATGEHGDLLDIIRATPTRPESVDVRLRKTVGKLLKYEAAILAGPEKPFSYDVHALGVAYVVTF